MGELKATTPDFNIEILGVNRTSDSAFNSLVTTARTLPWAQDTTQDKVWEGWGVVYRDVRIVDCLNRVRVIYNLTEHDLSLENNRQTLKNLFLSVAKTVDTDKDLLPDDWERLYFGNLSADPRGDPDGDGYDNLTEFAAGTLPLDPTSHPTPTTKVVGQGALKTLTLVPRRRSGGLLNYTLESSSDLVHWESSSEGLTPSVLPRTLFDGSGMPEVIYTLPATKGFQMLRFRASPR